MKIRLPFAGEGRPASAPSGSALFPFRLRSLIPHEEFDYQTLLLCLQEYLHPRDKISDLISKGIIVRVKKGLYVFGEPYRRRPVSREVLANLIYGPSYISLEYALQYHGLIPEGVETLTSVTSGRSRGFDTPLGEFTYRGIPLRAFREGMDIVHRDDGLSFLLATPEKALADKIVSDRGLNIRTKKDVRHYLYDSLRMPPGECERLDPSRIVQYARSFGSMRLNLLARVVQDARNGFEGDA